jgi:tetratricopeptide (TPR) repeat protein
MSDPHTPGKGSARVPVHYFQKKVAAPAAVPEPDEISATAQTMPITREDILRVTQQPPVPLAVRPQPLAKAPRGKARKSVPPKGGKRSSRRTRTPIAVSTDPALWYHVEKMNALKSQGAAGAVDREKLAELALDGHKLFEQGKLDQAREVFEGIVGKGTPDAFPHAMLGTIYLAQGQDDRALALFEAALAIDPDDIAALVYRAELRINGGSLKPAVEDLMRAVKLRPSSDPFVDRAQKLLSIAQKLKTRRKR